MSSSRPADTGPSAEADPALSIVVVTYACRALALDCLATLEAQRSELDLQVIVVDNDSPDGTLEAVREHHGWVEAISSGANGGFARANNIGLGRARGAFVLLLNPDTLVPAGALRAAVDELSRRPATGMLGCKLVQPDGSLDHACKRGFPTPASAFFYLSGLARLRPRSPRLAAYTAGHVGPDDISPIDAVNGAFMLVRREALASVGGLDERYWMYGEDLDWCLRFWQHGWEVLYWPVVEVVHVKGGSSSKTRGWRTNRAFHEAMWRFYADHYAPTRPAAVTAAVWLAIRMRFTLSAARSFVLRRIAAS